MSKIMFSDKYGFTESILTECKTQTRRIIPSADHANRRLEGTLVITDKKGYKQVMAQFSDKRVLSAYAIGEVLAIAQAYKDIPEFPLLSKQGVEELKQSPGWRNKMFVNPYLMPHHIRITNICVERLQDISDEDCIEEGIIRTDEGYCFYCQNGNMPTFYSFPTPQSAYASLIDKVCGKGTWDSNPFVFAYEFELID